MRGGRVLAVLCVAAVLATPAAAKKKTGFMKKPGKAAVEGFSVTPAAEPCASFGWAAAVESILALDEVALPQRELVTKVFGGELCVESGLDLRKLGAAVNGEYVLGPKRKMKIVTRVFPAGAPLSAEDIIAAIQRKRPMILFWKSRPYVAVGAAYDEWIGPQGMRLWEISEIALLDPVTQETVTFQKGRDDTRELTGAMEFVLFPMQEIEWVPMVATPR